MKKMISEFTLGDIYVRYITDEDKNVGLVMVPAGMENKIAEKKEYTIDSLVQVKVLGDDYPVGFSHGHTMRNGESVANLNYDQQQVIEEDDEITILTILKTETGHVAEHRLIWDKISKSLTIDTTYTNHCNKDITLEMLSSFSLGGITPFAEGEASEVLQVHRLRSKWSSEGRLETIPIADLQLEPSWSRYAVQSERFGQIGSMPVRKFFPFAAVEDVKNNVTLGVQLACASSWQMELYRRDNALAISGGIADYEFGHWLKRLKPGEKIKTPQAYVSVTKGGINDISQRLISRQKQELPSGNNNEEELPVVFNEWCTTWGEPSQENIKNIVEKIKNKGIKYFVIDAGWYADKDKGWGTIMGDWNICQELFPDGLEKTVAIIKEAGMIPGIWFEFEICGRDAAAFNMKDHLLHRNGKVITTGNRRFWDMRDPWVVSYLSEKVIDFLKKYEFGYLKIDYNDNIGIGCDGTESPGEGLRQQVAASKNFIKKIREEIPEIVIENCSSGGHRLEPSMMAISDMGSFSDAHECQEIPIIAANLHRSILPQQSQIWAVLRKKDQPQRLVYSLASTFLGRMCLSGDVLELNDEQWQIVDQGIQFYKIIAPIIKNGFSYRYGPRIQRYRSPRGWQAVLRVTEDKSRAFAVIHTFGGQIPEKIEIELPEDLHLKVKAIFTDGNVTASVKNGVLTCPVNSNFQAAAVYMK